MILYVCIYAVCKYMQCIKIIQNPHVNRPSQFASSIYIETGRSNHNYHKSTHELP